MLLLTLAGGRESSVADGPAAMKSTVPSRPPKHSELQRGACTATRARSTPLSPSNWYTPVGTAALAMAPQPAQTVHGYWGQY